MGKFEVRKKMYFPKGAVINGHSGYTVGMLGVAGAVSRLNASSAQKAHVSVAALAMSKVVDGSMKVAGGNGHEIAFVEYVSDATGELKSFIVRLDDQNKVFDVKTVQGVGSEKGAVEAVFAAIAYSEAISDKIVQADPSVTDGVLEIKDAAASGFRTDSDMLIACDAFYYVTKGYEIDFDAMDAATFDAQKKQMERGGFFKECPGAQFPDSITVKNGGTATKRRKKKSDIHDEPLDDFMKRCLDGYFIVDYPWDDDMKACIKPLKWLKRYVPVEEFRETLISAWKQANAILERMKTYVDLKKVKESCNQAKRPMDVDALIAAGLDYDEVLIEPVNIQVMGKPGTGKTTLVEAVLCALGIPHGFINCKGRAEEDDIEGLNKIVQGKVCSIPTKIVELWRRGGAVDLEEMNLPDSDILQGALGQALVYPYVLKADGYYEMRRHPLMIMFGTLNPDANGTKPMNQGFKSRFDEGYILEDVNDDEFVKILYSTGYDKDDCDYVFKMYKEAIKYLTDNGGDDYVLSITIRGCKKAIQKLANGFSRKQAIRCAFISQIYSDDKDVALDLEAHLEGIS